MLENERNIVEEIDKLILDEFENIMKIKKDTVSIISDNKIENILKRINEKMKVIFLLFQGDFSINERIIEEKIALGKRDLNFYDKIANRIILKRLDEAIEKVEKLKHLDGQLISVCFDIKLFIQKVLMKNLSISFIEKYIKMEEIER